MTNFVYKGLTRNPEIGKTCLSSAQYLETGWCQGYQIWQNVSNEQLLNAAKWQGSSFYRF